MPGTNKPFAKGKEGSDLGEADGSNAGSSIHEKSLDENVGVSDTRGEQRTQKRLEDEGA